jgi:hypothetical protein
MRMPEALLPVGAILRREQLAMLRSWRPFILMGLIILVVGGMAGLFVSIASPEEFELHRIGDACAALYYTCSIALMVGVALFVPTAAAASVVSEVERETFEMLTLTHVRPYHFWFAKFVCGATYTILLTAAIAPIAGLAFFGVGLDIELLGVTLFAVLGCALQAAAAGTLAGCYFKRTAPAIVLANILNIALAGVAVFIILIPLDEMGLIRLGSGDMLENTMSGSSPLALLVIYWAQEGAYDAGWLFFVCTGTVAAEVSILFVIAMLLLRRRWRNMEAWDKRGVFTRPLRLRRERHKPYRFRPFADGGNPIFALETRFGTRVIGLSGLRLAMWTSIFMTVAWLLLIVQTYVTRYIEGETLIAFAVATLIGFPLLLPAYLANGFTKEIERDTAVGLAMTTLSPLEIILGKLRAGMVLCVCLGGPWAIGSAAYVFACHPAFATFNSDWPELVSGAAVSCLSVTVFLWVALASCVTASLLVRRTVSALVLSYIFLLMVGGGIMACGLAVLLGLQESGLVGAYFFEGSDPAVYLVLFSLSPVGALSYLLDGLGQWNRTGIPYIVSHVWSIGLCMLAGRFCVWRFKRWAKSAVAP